MINGYIKIRVMKDGRYADCWQLVKDGVVKDHVNDDGKSVQLPDVHEAVVLSGQVHFAPNVLNDPDAPPTEPLFATPISAGLPDAMFKVIEPFGEGVGPAPEPATSVKKV